MLAVGVIEGIAEATASMMKLVSGVVSDRYAARKPLVLLGYGLAALTSRCFRWRTVRAASSRHASSTASARASAVRRAMHWSPT